VPRYGRLKNIAQIIKHEYGCENMNDDELERLSVIANVLQIANFIMNVKETSNDEIMKMLEHQDREYLDCILDRLDNIEKHLGINNKGCFKNDK
jgi:hypothetical protein